MSNTLPTRSEIPEALKWNYPSVFDSAESWAASLQSIEDDLPKLAEYKGKLSSDPKTLAACLKLAESVTRRAETVGFYAYMTYACETTDEAATEMLGRAEAVGGGVNAALAFIQPELIAIGQDTLNQWMKDEADLAYLEHHVSDLFRKQAHIRSAEVEEVLGMASPIFSGPQSSTSMLTNADFDIPQAIDSDGNEHPVNPSTIDKLKDSADRTLVENGWNLYHDEYLKHKHTLAANYNTSVQQNVFQMRVRGYDSTVGMSLAANNIPVSVYDSLLETFRAHLPVWHKYFAIRKKALGVDNLMPFDMWSPLCDNPPHIPYQTSVDMICNGLKPLGDEYVAAMRAGCLTDRWVDSAPSQGKSGGAFSYGTYDTMPVIMMHYQDSIGSLSTLAHELGHSMHSYLSNKNQPHIYSNYSLFAAEVASNFNQALTREYLFETESDRDFQISLIEEAMANYYRYFFIMPTLATFELETHRRVEQGGSLTAPYLNELCTKLFTEGYGDGVMIDERVGAIWATFGHMFSDYYVFQYATGIAGASALAKRVLGNEPNAVENYLGFLKAGSSAHPLDALKAAGVDLTKPQPVADAFAIMEGYVDRLGELLA